MPTVQLFRGCAMRGGGVSIDRASCVDLARVPSRNKDKCCPHKCASPWRLCIACVSQGAADLGTVDVSKTSRREDGLCDYHAEHGFAAIKKRGTPGVSSGAQRGAASGSPIVHREVSVGHVAEPLLARTNGSGVTPPVAAARPAPQMTPAPQPALPSMPVSLPGPSRERDSVVTQVTKSPTTSQTNVQPPAPSPIAKEGQDVPVDEMPDGPWKEILQRVKRALSQSTYEPSVDPRKIRPLPGQPRTVFNPVRLLRLRASMIESGQIQPITLRRIEPDADGNEYELVDGERRWRSSMAGQEMLMLRAMVVAIDDEAAQYVIAVLANFNREEHTPLEACDAIVRMHEGLKMPMDAIAKMFGKSGLWVAQRYGLRRLVPEVRELLDPELDEHEQLTITAAIRISQKTPETQLTTARRVLRGEMHVNQIRSDALERGEAVNTFQRTPAHQIELLADNASAIKRIIEKLKNTLESTDEAVLANATPQRRAHLLATLGAVAELIHELRSTLATAFAEEKPPSPPVPQVRPAERLPVPLPRPIPTATTVPSADRELGFVTVDYYERTAGSERKLVKAKKVNVVEYGAHRNNGALGWQVDGKEQPKTEADFCSRMGIRFR